MGPLIPSSMEIAQYPGQVVDRQTSILAPEACLLGTYVASATRSDLRYANAHGIFPLALFGVVIDPAR